MQVDLFKQENVHGKFITLVTGVFFPLGLLFGSLCNVLIYRIPLMLGVTEDPNEMDAHVNLWWPPSHCPCCKAPIAPWDNIPVLSWLLLGGKCRHCQAEISLIYPLSELLMGLIWAGLSLFCAWLYPPTVAVVLALAYSLFFMVLYAAAVIDFKFLILPDMLVFTLLWGGLLLSASGYSTVRPQEAIGGVAVGWLLLWCVMKLWLLLSKTDGLGYGDVKLYAACGAWFGWHCLPELLTFSAMLGLIFYAITRLFTMRSKPDAPFYIPFGPAIALTAFLLLFWRV